MTGTSSHIGPLESQTKQLIYNRYEYFEILCDRCTTTYATRPLANISITT